MTDTRADSSLSPTEIVVLARLSQDKEPSDDDLGKAVRDMCVPGESASRARAMALEAMERLQQRALVTSPGTEAIKNKGKRKRRKGLTDAGGRALCAAFGLARKPTWAAVRDKHLPALALGLQPGSDAAAKATRDMSSILATVLGVKRGVGKAATPTAVCDVLIAEMVGLPPGKVTLDRIRVHVLTQHVGVLQGATEKPAKLMPRVLSALIGASEPIASNKESLLPVLGHRGLRSVPVLATSTPQRETLPQDRTSSPPQLSLVTASASPAPGQSSPGSAVPPPQPSLPDEDLLDEVREALREVGADGRFGTEKVFVSALWHRIEGARRRADLSLDGFKRWLVNANRDGWLVLARADLIGAMDAKQVAESEIRDLGATFHFVLDGQRGEPASRGGSHVR